MLKVTKTAVPQRFALILLAAVVPAWAVEPAQRTDRDLEGWGLSGGTVVADAAGGGHVRLALRADRGLAQLTRTVPVQAGRDYVLRLDYAATAAESARDHGAWIYLAFRDAKDATVADLCRPLDQAPAWRGRTIPFTAPVGAAKAYLSFRQQQRAGTLDLRAVEVAPVATGAAVALGPSALAALAWLTAPGAKVGPHGERPPREGDPFQPFLAGVPPPVTREIGSATVGDVVVRKVAFRSLTVGGEAQDVFAIIARPVGGDGGGRPGILWLHGGWGCADEARAIRFARAGYVAVAPDLPGIADPRKCPDSIGPWAQRFGALAWTTGPEPSANQYFDAVVAALQAFDLLAAQPGVARDRLGVTGISMGGYTTTMVTGLLGARVRAAWSIYGCGFYELGSEWQAGLRNLPDDERDAWLRHFDAGRRAPGIKAPYFLAAAVRDHFFWPPAVNATLRAVPAGSNQAFAHLVTHRLDGIPGAEGLDLLWFGHWLKGEGRPFPSVQVESCEALPDGGRRIAFAVQAPEPVQTATLYTTTGGPTWEASAWEPVAARPAGLGRFQADLPAARVVAGGAWFVAVSDARPATAGSLVYASEAVGAGAALRPFGVGP